MTKRPGTGRCGQERLRLRGGPSTARAMTENTHSNDNNGANQAAMTDDLFGWPGDGLHSTNPDHLIPSKPSPMNVPPVRAADGYAGGRPRGRFSVPSRSQSRPFDPADLMLDPVRPIEQVPPISLDFSCGGFWGVLGRLGPMLAGLWGLIVLDGYDESAGVARWAGFPGPKGLSGRLNS
jgi:hypothetical protein